MKPENFRTLSTQYRGKTNTHETSITRDNEIIAMQDTWHGAYEWGDYTAGCNATAHTILDDFTRDTALANRLAIHFLYDYVSDWNEPLFQISGAEIAEWLMQIDSHVDHHGTLLVKSHPA